MEILLHVTLPSAILPLIGIVMTLVISVTITVRKH